MHAENGQDSTEVAGTTHDSAKTDDTDDKATPTAPVAVVHGVGADEAAFASEADVIKDIFGDQACIARVGQDVPGHFAMALYTCHTLGPWLYGARDLCLPEIRCKDLAVIGCLSAEQVPQPGRGGRARSIAELAERYGWRTAVLTTRKIPVIAGALLNVLAMNFIAVGEAMQVAYQQAIKAVITGEWRHVSRFRDLVEMLIGRIIDREAKSMAAPYAAIVEDDGFFLAGAHDSYFLSAADFRASQEAAVMIPPEQRLAAFERELRMRMQETWNPCSQQGVLPGNEQLILAGADTFAFPTFGK